MFLRRLEVTNYMIHQSTRVNLYPVTVFVGSNNGGKSALFDALLNFSMVSRGRLSQAFGQGPRSYQSTRHRGASKASRIGYRVEISSEPEDSACVEYTVTYSQKGGVQDPPSYVIHDETLTRLDTGLDLFSRANIDACTIPGVVNYIGEDQSLFAAVRHAQFTGQYEETDPLVTEIARDISRVSKFRLVPHFLRDPSPLPETAVEDPGAAGRAPRISYSGRDLAAVLYYLAEVGSPVLDEIVARCKEVVSGFEGFDFNTTAAGEIGFSVRFGDVRGTVSAAMLSDGTVSLIGYLALLLGPSRPPVLMLEEPENGLTPRSTRAIYEAVLEAAKPTASPRTQVLVSSHSPHVIVQAWNGEERDFIYQVKVSDGRAVVRPFKDIIDEAGYHLQKDEHGDRKTLGLPLADRIMDGYWS